MWVYCSELRQGPFAYKVVNARFVVYQRHCIISVGLIDISASNFCLSSVRELMAPYRKRCDLIHIRTAPI